VQLETIVEADGSIGGVRVTKSLDKEHGLDEEAVKSMTGWKFEPGRRDGEPVAVAIVVEIAFTLR
jgi:protein TonB